MAPVGDIQYSVAGVRVCYRKAVAGQTDSLRYLHFVFLFAFCLPSSDNTSFKNALWEIVLALLVAYFFSHHDRLVLRTNRG